MTDRFFVVGYCPSCGTGPLGVRLCGACGKPHVLCEECDAMWLTRDTTEPCIFPRQPDIPCAGCGHSLRDEPAHWATWQELVELSWQLQVVAQGRPWTAEASPLPSSDPACQDPRSAAKSSNADKGGADIGPSQESR